MHVQLLIFFLVSVYAPILMLCGYITVLVTGVTVENFHAVVIFENLTLRCDPSSVLNSTVVQITYQWHRVGGSIPEKSIGNESRELTIPRVVPEDEGLYYCMGFHFGHCAVSNNATVIVDGEK